MGLDLGLLMDIIGYATLFVTVCSAVLFWSTGAKKHTEVLFLGYYLILLVVIGGGSKVLFYLKENNLPLLHLHTLGEFLLLSMFYRRLLSNKKFITWIIFIVGAGIILNSVFLQNIWSINSNARAVAQATIIFYSLLLFFDRLKAIDSKILYRPLFLINTAILIYFSGSLIIFIFSEIFSVDQNVYVTIQRY